MQIVKLGGSVITVKSRYRYFRQNATARILENLRLLDDDLIVIHGGGSFGHIMAKEYHIPGKLTPGSTKGASVIHRDMVDLDQRVISLMIQAKFPAIAIPPASFSPPDAIPYDAFSGFLEAGLTPVSFGDVYIMRGNAGILSGDDIVLHLAEHFRPNQVIFLSDVDGIFDRNPKKYMDAKLQPELNGNEEFDIMGADVTGGMGRKVNLMHEIAELGISVYLINGNHPERIGDIGSSKFKGTVIH